MDIILGILAILGFLIFSLLGTLIFYSVFINKDESSDKISSKNKMYLIILMIVFYAIGGSLGSYSGVFKRRADDTYIRRP